MFKTKDSNERQSELREGAEAGKFCKKQSFNAKLGIAVIRDRARHESRLPLIKRIHESESFLFGMTETRTPSAKALNRVRATCEQSAKCVCEELETLKQNTKARLMRTGQESLVFR